VQATRSPRCAHRAPGGSRLYIPAVSESRAWTRPRFLLALLLAVLVAEAVPAPAAAARRDKGNAASAWRALSVRPAEQGGDPDPRGVAPFAGIPPAPLALPFFAHADADASQTPLHRPAARVAARLPLPRAPPMA
jgi:hypothetical protein